MPDNLEPLQFHFFMFSNPRLLLRNPHDILTIQAEKY